MACARLQPDNATRETAPAVPVPSQRLLDHNARRHTAIYSPRFEVIRTRERWLAVWQEMRANHFPPGLAPHVEFSHSMLLLAAMGGRPTYGYDISIEKIFRHRDTLQVHVAHQCPAPDAFLPQSGTAPVDVVAIPKSALPAVFVQRPDRCAR